MITFEATIEKRERPHINRSELLKSNHLSDHLTMKRRHFLQATAVAAGTTTVIPSMASPAVSPQPPQKDLYELRIYPLTSGGAKTQLMNYLTTAFIPAINQFGGKVGIFSEYSLQEPPKLYVLIVYSDAENILNVAEGLDRHAGYLEKAASYLQSPADKPLFDRIIGNISLAFDSLPRMRQPDPERGLLELRIYESYNEDAGRRKILMFNKEEIPLFDKVGLPIVFFGKNIAGNNLPALTYMLWFKDMVHREEAWGKFRAHPEWEAMRNKPEYANIVSTVNKIFLLPEKGSQI